MGLKSLPLVTGRCSGLDFWGIPVEKGVWVWTFKSYSIASYGVGLLGLDPRIIKVLPRLPNGGFFLWCACVVKVFSPIESFFFGGGLDPPPDSLTFSFILACVCCSSSTCRVNLYKTDIWPISLIPELIGMVDKAKEYGSVRCRVLFGKGSKDNFPKIF